MEFGYSIILTKKEMEILNSALEKLMCAYNKCFDKDYYLTDKEMKLIEKLKDKLEVR